MALTKTTDMGIITISNDLITGLLFEAESLPECVGRLWIASPKGRIPGMMAQVTGQEKNRLCRIRLDAQDRIELSFSVVTQFGTSIKEVTKMVSDHIVSRLQEITGMEVSLVTVFIVGVRSKQIAKRNIKAVYTYV